MQVYPRCEPEGGPGGGHTQVLVGQVTQLDPCSWLERQSKGVANTGQVVSQVFEWNERICPTPEELC